MIKALQVIFLIFLSANFALADELSDIVARGKLRVAVCKIEQAPFYSTDPSTKKLTGVDVNVAKAIAEELGVELEIVQERDSWDALIEDVATKQVDLAISYISLTPKRIKRVEFSEPYTTVRPVFLINRGALATASHQGHFTLAEVFNNKDNKFKILAYDGSSYLDLAKKLFPEGNIKPITDLEQVKEQLLKDEAAAYFSDEVEIAGLLLQHPEYKLKLVAYPFKDNSDIIAIPVNNDNHKLLSFVNAVLKMRNLSYDVQPLINPTFGKETAQ